jgi:hypothetical protein
MKRFLITLISLAFFSFSQEKIHVLYTSLDPLSVSQHLAFYQLFPDTPDGKKALQDAWKLLSKNGSPTATLAFLHQSSINSLVTFITKAEGEETPALTPHDLKVIQKLGAHLPNRKLKGYLANSEEEVLALPPHEVDLSRGLLLSHDEGGKIDSYDALIDLMALQILTRTQLDAPPETKIRTINRFIFEEMGYRFPPHSVYAQDIDLYTYLPSVIDSRRGVCLGVSILYLALSQRLGLELQALTPPGHIYVRHMTPEKTINIETTARGIHLDTKEYLGIESETIPVRSIKDVIGLAYFNEASVHWQNKNFQKALKCYQKASLYLPDDLLLKELMGFNYLFVGEMDQGRALLQEVYKTGGRHDQYTQRTVVEDYLKGKVDHEGIQVLFLHVDEKRESLLAKKTAIEQALQKWPEFRAGYFHLAVTWLQLSRHKEALLVLQQYEDMTQNDPTAEYFLAQVYAVRSNYPKAWEHLHRAMALLAERDPMPETLVELKKALEEVSPE